MNKNPLQQKPEDRLIWLEKELAKKEKLLGKYKQALKESHRKVTHISKELQFGLSVIGQIHNNLKPVETLKLPHFHFSYKVAATRKGVSGDFFDIIPLTDPMKVGILLSSCNSYALAAWLLSVLFQKSDTPLHTHQTAKSFLLSLSDQIATAMPQSEPIHIFYGILNRRDFTLDCASAGHIFAGLKPQGQPTKRLPFCPKTLSKKNKKSLVSQTLNLEPGDTLVICSPGVLERQNNKGKSFGSEPIINILSKQEDLNVLELRQKILFQTERFAGALPAHKDQTVLAFSVKDRLLKLA